MQNLASSGPDATGRRLGMPHATWPDIVPITSALMGAIGLYVVAGWIIGSEAMVRVVPQSVSMSLNTAILFIAAAILLWTSPPSRVRSIAVWVLAALSCVILVEHSFDLDLGVDWAALHQRVHDGNPRPGRTAPNAVAGFLLTALFFVLVDYKPTLTSRTLQ